MRTIDVSYQSRLKEIRNKIVDSTFEMAVKSIEVKHKHVSFKPLEV